MPTMPDRIQFNSIDYVRADRVQGLVDALQFYADAETYFATTLFCDRPCGAIEEDYGPVPSLHADHETIMELGKRARTALVTFRSFEEKPIP